TAPDGFKISASPRHFRPQTVANLFHPGLAAGLVQLSTDATDLGRLRACRRDAAVCLHVRDVVQSDQLIERGLWIAIRRGSLAASKELAQEPHRSPPHSVPAPPESPACGPAERRPPGVYSASAQLRVGA